MFGVQETESGGELEGFKEVPAVQMELLSALYKRPSPAVMPWADWVRRIGRRVRGWRGWR